MVVRKPPYGDSMLRWRNSGELEVICADVPRFGIINNLYSCLLTLQNLGEHKDSLLKRFAARASRRDHNQNPKKCTVNENLLRTRTHSEGSKSSVHNSVPPKDPRVGDSTARSHRQAC